MKKTFTTHQDASGLTINLNPGQPWAIKFGLSIYALIYLVMGIGIVFALGAVITSGNVGLFYFVIIAVLLVYTAVFFLLVRSFIRRLTQEETLFIDATYLTLTDKHLFGTKIKRFELKHIRQICPVGMENFTDHPMEDGNAAINFAVNERLIRYQISDGNVMIIAGKHQVRFGKNIPSWDAEEFIQEIERYTGRSFTPVAKADTYVVTEKFRGQM